MARTRNNLGRHTLPRRIRTLLPAVWNERLEERTLFSTIVVNTLGDVTNYVDGKTTFREAVVTAKAGDTINFAASLTAAGPATIALTGSALAIAKNLAVVGPGANKLTIKAAAGKRVFDITAGIVRVSSVTVTGGNAGTARDSLGGAAIVQQGASLNVDYAAFVGNTAFSGGALFGYGKLNVIHTTFSGNVATGPTGTYMGSDPTGGGAVACYAAGTFTDCTFNGNKAVAGRGGAIVSYSDKYGFAQGNVTLSNVTVSGNSAAQGGGVANVGGILLLNNSIVSGNLRGLVADDVFGYLNPASTYNLLGVGSGIANGSNGNKVGVTNPKLSSLQYNGGTTRTMVPLAGSPVIDAGDPNFNFALVGPALLLDQRGFTRVTDANGDYVARIDMGAVESAGKIVVARLADGPSSTVNAGTINLRQAINLANNGPAADTIVFAPAVRGTVTITGGSAYEIKSDVFIDGPGASLLAVNANRRSRVFMVSSGKATLDGMTITGGATNPNFVDGNRDEGGGILNKSNLTLTGVTVSGNSAYKGGGISNLGSLAMSDCVVSDNHADYDGGGLLSRGTATLSNTAVSGNIAAANDGGGIWNSGTLSVTGGALAYNGDAYQFGVGCLFNSGTATLSRTSVTGSKSITTGGIVNTGRMTIVSSTIDNNSSRSGGGINNSGILSITGSTISNNMGGYGTGGISNARTLTLVNCTLAGNKDGAGGALSCGTGSTSTLVNVTISGNTAYGVAGRTDLGLGGGILIESGAKVIARNSLISGNFSQPSLGAAKANDIVGKLDATSAYNLIGVGGGLVNGVNHNKVGITGPKLGALANNGGPTKTMALLTGSPAINAGSNALAIGPDGKLLATDQRGLPRIVGSVVDIGAFEK